MNPAITDYLKEFQEVMFLPEAEKETWAEWEEKCPSLIKGWFELSHLPLGDRLEFLEDYWLKTLPYIPGVHKRIRSFFQNLEDVQIFLVKDEGEAYYEALCLYPTKTGDLFIGYPPIGEFDENQLLPEDYFAFLRIHNLFIKKNGWRVFPLEEMSHYQEKIIEKVLSQEKLTFNGKSIELKNLLPFACNEGETCFQCFFRGWYPGEKLGNICIDLEKNQLSGPLDPESYRTFLDWLMDLLDI